MGNKILRLPTVKSLTGLSRSTIYAYISEGTFPKQLVLGERAVGWVEAEITDWIDERIQERNEEVKSNG